MTTTTWIPHMPDYCPICGHATPRLVAADQAVHDCPNCLQRFVVYVAVDKQELFGKPGHGS